MKTVQINDEQEITVSLAPKTLGGNDATMDGPVTWEQTEGDATIEVSEDGLSATIRSGEAGQVNRFNVSGDADLDEGTTTITEEIVVTVGKAAAVGFGASFGEPAQKA